MPTRFGSTDDLENAIRRNAQMRTWPKAHAVAVLGERSECRKALAALWLRCE